MSGNTESVTESVKGSATGGGGTAGVTGPGVTGAEAADIQGHDVAGAGASGSAAAATGVAATGVVSAAGARGSEVKVGGARGGAVKAGAGAREAGAGSAQSGTMGTQRGARSGAGEARSGAGEAQSGAGMTPDGEPCPTGIGARLARAREDAGLTVAALSRFTRIREPVIRAIEHDDFSITGGDFYARGHIRNIARVVGLDPEALVHEYDDQHGGIPIPVRAAEVFLAEIPIRLRERRTFNWTTAMAVVLVMVVAFGVVRLMIGSGEVDPTGLRRPAGTPAAKPAAPSGAPAPRRPAAPAEAGTVVLRVTADRPTRLTVRDGKGKRLFRGMFQGGSSSEWRAKGRIDVTAADAGAVRLEVNGKDLGPAGREGERVTRVFGPNPPGMR